MCRWREELRGQAFVFIGEVSSGLITCEVNPLTLRGEVHLFPKL